MNRPNKETLTEWSLNSYADYTNELEKYCDKLEKREAPMKVHKKETVGEITVGNTIFKLDYMWVCPNCGIWISPSHDKRYCSRCGQRLEYEDE